MDARGSTFEESFRGEYSGVVRVVAPIVGSVADAEAVVQEAFAKAFVRWRRIGRYERPGAWVRRVAIRDAVRVAAKQRRGVSVNVRSSHVASDAIETAIDIERALGALTPQQRACVVLYYLADWPVGKVADAVGCREPTVRVHLHRARATLAGLLSDTRDEVTDGR